MLDLWLASNNSKKRLELERNLAGLPVRLRTPSELGQPFDPVEDQETFFGNARRKAELLAQLSGDLALGDDSGLCVDALDGGPGIRSARYGGPGLDDRGRLERLLEELRDVPPERRGARFVCSLCLCGPDGSVLAAVEERCEGRLRMTPTGEGGFGYDPIFVPEEFVDDPAASFATLSAEAKDRLSHRGKALRKLVAAMRAVLLG
ncbi:MAG: hypothetical protein RL398_1935 [Planctomycetota bacterium]